MEVVISSYCISGSSDQKQVNWRIKYKKKDGYWVSNEMLNDYFLSRGINIVAYTWRPIYE